MSSVNVAPLHKQGGSDDDVLCRIVVCKLSVIDRNAWEMMEKLDLSEGSLLVGKLDEVSGLGRTLMRLRDLLENAVFWLSVQNLHKTYVGP